MYWTYSEKDNTYGAKSGVRDRAGDTWPVYAVVEYHTQEDCDSFDDENDPPHWHWYVNMNRPNGENYFSIDEYSTDLEEALKTAWGEFVGSIEDGVDEEDQPEED